MASIGSQTAPGFARDRTASAIASARRAVLADRYAINSFTVEWRAIGDLPAIAEEWRALAARAIEPNVFYEPGFALAAAPVFGADVGAVLVWSGTAPRELLGFFPARVSERRYGLRLPVLIGWTHPYAPLGTPLVDRDAAEPVIAAWLAYLAVDPAVPGLLLLPLVAAHGPFAATLDGILGRAQMPSESFGSYRRALLEPGDDRAHYLEHAVSTHRLRELQRSGRRLADRGALLFTATAAPVAAEIDEFFALEAGGWKGEAGTAASSRDDTRVFFKAALAALALEGKVGLNRLLLDGRAIAAAVTLRSGGAAWYWKTAYDESFARQAPGMLLTAALTEQLAADVTIARTDSCAAPGTAVLDPLWRERLTLSDRLIAVRPEALFAPVCRLEHLRRAAFQAAKSVRTRLRRQR